MVLIQQTLMVLLVMMFLQVTLSYLSKMQLVTQLVVTPSLTTLAPLSKIKLQQYLQVKLLHTWIN